MKVTGEAILHAPVERVWQALNDPAVLVRTIPGCHRLEETGPDQYAMTVVAGVASIKGLYQGNVRLTDQDPPSSFVLRADGAGGPGTVDAYVTVRLRETDGATRLDYDADATVGGTIAGVGQRVLAGVARRTANDFFAAIDAELTGAELTGAAPAAPPAQAAEPVPARGGEEAAAPRVFTAPAGGIVRGGGASAASFLAGGLVALAGVLVGWLIGRGSRR
jgi:uncharacterized protein